MVAIDLAFNMGIHFIEKFSNFTQALIEGNMKRATHELKYVDSDAKILVESKYFKTTPYRANTNISILESG